MADPREWLILDAIRARLATINGSGIYTYDLSGSDQVVITDMPIDPQVLPFASVTFGGIRTERGEVLTQYAPTLTVNIGILAQYTAETPSSRTRAVLALLYDVRRALEADRHLIVDGVALAYDLCITREDSLVGDSPEMDASYIGISVEVTVYRARDPGGA